MSACKVGVLVFGAACLSWASHKTAPSGPTIVEFDPAGSTYTVPSAINQSGQVTGSYNDPSGVNHGFLREADGTILSFDPPGSTNTISNGINGSGVMTGSYHDTHDYGFIREANGDFITFDASYGGSGFGTYPYAISDSGEVAGGSYDSSHDEHSFLRQSNGTITNFDPPGAESDTAYGIGPNGEVIGSATINGTAYGYIRDQSGTITTFSAPGSVNGTYPASINRSGQIAGIYYGRENSSHGFVRDQFGHFTTFTVSGGVCGASQYAIVTSINDAGEVAGYTVTSHNCATGFLHKPESGVTFFRAPDAGGAFNAGTYAGGLNDSGTVEGFYIDAEGVFHGYVGY
jgi:hypothetical protein